MIERNYLSTTQNFFDDARGMFAEEAVRIEQSRSPQYSRFQARNPQLDPVLQLALVVAAHSRVPPAQSPSPPSPANANGSVVRSLSLCKPDNTGAVTLTSMPGSVPAHAVSLPSLVASTPASPAASASAASEPCSPEATPPLPLPLSSSDAQLLVSDSSIAPVAAVLPDELNVPLARSAPVLPLPDGAHEFAQRPVLQPATRTSSSGTQAESTYGALFRPLLLVYASPLLCSACTLSKRVFSMCYATKLTRTCSFVCIRTCTVLTCIGCWLSYCSRTYCSSGVCCGWSTRSTRWRALCARVAPPRTRPPVLPLPPDNIQAL